MDLKSGYSSKRRETLGIPSGNQNLWAVHVVSQSGTTIILPHAIEGSELQPQATLVKGLRKKKKSNGWAQF